MTERRWISIEAILNRLREMRDVAAVPASDRPNWIRSVRHYARRPHDGFYDLRPIAGAFLRILEGARPRDERQAGAVPPATRTIPDDEIEARLRQLVELTAVDERGRWRRSMESYAQRPRYLQQVASAFLLIAAATWPEWHPQQIESSRVVRSPRGPDRRAWASGIGPPPAVSGGHSPTPGGRLSPSSAGPRGR